MVTWCPFSASAIPVARPAMPVPTITTSKGMVDVSNEKKEKLELVKGNERHKWKTKVGLMMLIYHISTNLKLKNEILDGLDVLSQ